MTNLLQARCDKADNPASQLRSAQAINAQAINARAINARAISLARMLLAILGLGVIVPGAVVGQDYSPDHPKVRAMVDRGVDYLAKLPPQRNMYEGGNNLLIAYTLYKASGKTDTAAFKAGIDKAVDMAHSLSNPSTAAGNDNKIVYAASVAAVLLADVDANLYRPELQLILEWLVSVQKPHGGFGYPTKPTGDTSQVQYAMLALWAMSQAGLDVPIETVESTVKYLQSTIDPSGGWGYQGVVSRGVPVPQEQVSKVLATAGVGALLIAGDLLGFFRQVSHHDESEGIPEAFVRVDLQSKQLASRRSHTLSRSDIDPLIESAFRYQYANGFNGGFWYYYWRYSQERYESFREIMEGKQRKSPKWYVDGVNELTSLQADDGSFSQSKKADYTSDDLCTCFAILFLIRSTQKTIGKLDEGVAFGGYGLPTDVTTVKMVGNRIVSDADTSAQDLLKMLEQEDGRGGQLEWQLSQMQLSSDPVARREQVSRLARLLTHGEYTARRVAAKLLGRSEDLDQVPVLIDALSDEDPYVPQLAEESLRLLSRRLSHPKLEVASEPAQRKVAIEYWKGWYLGLRPDYVFLVR